MFEELTVPFCGFNDINRTKSSLKKNNNHIFPSMSVISIDDFLPTKYGHLQLSSKVPFPLEALSPFPHILESLLLETTTR